MHVVQNHADLGHHQRYHAGAWVHALHPLAPAALVLLQSAFVRSPTNVAAKDWGLGRRLRHGIDRLGVLFIQPFLETLGVHAFEGTWVKALTSALAEVPGLGLVPTDPAIPLIATHLLKINQKLLTARRSSLHSAASTSRWNPITERTACTRLFRAMHINTPLTNSRIMQVYAKQITAHVHLSGGTCVHHPCLVASTRTTSLCTCWPKVWVA